MRLNLRREICLNSEEEVVALCGDYDHCRCTFAKNTHCIFLSFYRPFHVVGRFAMPSKTHKSRLQATRRPERISCKFQDSVKRFSLFFHWATLLDQIAFKVRLINRKWWTGSQPYSLSIWEPRPCNY